jgi:uncharacterized membrane protein
MTELPRVELPSLMAQTDQVVRMGGARIAARDTIERADQDYELELHSKTRTEEVVAAERVISSEDQHARDREGRQQGRRREHDDDDPDEEHHLVDVTA